MSRIHPSAVVEPGARIAPDAQIGPMCFVGSRATLGPGSRLISHVAVLNRTTLGEGNTVWPGAVLGADPQDLKFHGEPSRLIIGDFNEIREGATLHIGTENGGGVTRVGDHNLIMVAAHIAHDCVIASHTVISNQVQLAGHVTVGDHAVIAGLTGIHHFVSIGDFAFVGGMSRVIHDVPPFMITEGHPGRVRGVNQTLLTRHRFPGETVDRLREAYKLLYRNAEEGAPNRTAQGLALLAERYPHDPCVMQLVQFVRNTTLGIHGRFRESERPDNPRGSAPR